MKGRLLTIWALVLLMVGFASAQFGPGMSLPTVEYNPVLLLDPKVQKELKLSPQVSGQIMNVFMQEGQKILPTMSTNNGGSTPAQRQKAMFAAVDNLQKHLAAMLTPPQRIRLRQLTLQSIGPTAVLQPKVAAQLGLTATQKAALSRSFTAATKGLAGKMSNHYTPEGWQSQMAQMGRLQAAAKVAGERTLLATLTSPQIAKWKAMKGRPFAMSGFLGSGGLVSGMGG